MYFRIHYSKSLGVCQPRFSDNFFHTPLANRGKVWYTKHNEWNEKKGRVSKHETDPLRRSPPGFSNGIQSFGRQSKGAKGRDPFCVSLCFHQLSYRKTSFFSIITHILPKRKKKSLAPVKQYLTGAVFLFKMQLLKIILPYP